MALPPPYVDNQTPFGSRAETINGIVYECENIDIRRATHKIERRDHIGQPNGFVLVADYPTGTMTVQLATAATPRLVVGNSFVDDFGLGSETWVIGETSDPFPQRDYWKQNVQIHLSPSPPTATS